MDMLEVLSLHDGVERSGQAFPMFTWNLWVYANFDCNLSCSYCVSQSHPMAHRKHIGFENVKRLMDEAVQLGFRHVYFTGGEPFLLMDIYNMLAYASSRLPTTVLTNAVLLRGKRLKKLASIASTNLRIQVSLDGAQASQHEAYRGPGTWEKTIEAIQRLLERGLQVQIRTTLTPANAGHLSELRSFCRSLGIPDDSHSVHPLVRHGFSKEGLEAKVDSLVPEVTVTRDGIFWHPYLASTKSPPVLRQIFPLAFAVEKIQQLYEEKAGSIHMLPVASS